MLVVSLNPGHDGAVAALDDQTLLVSLEGEKDSFARNAPVTPETLLSSFAEIGDLPDVIALGGWYKDGRLRSFEIGAGYFGVDPGTTRSAQFCGKTVSLVTSSHERAHITMAIGMAPRDDAPLRAVLVWEGAIGSFYLVDADLKVVRQIPVLGWPGTRYAALFALADSTFPSQGGNPRMADAGKLMALAAYGDPRAADPGIVAVVEELLMGPVPWPLAKNRFEASPVFNAGVEAQATKTAAALLTERIFDIYADTAARDLPTDIPLYISGGCGLNCEWNQKWRETGQFSSVFVPPCTNDSGIAIGHAIDALAVHTGDPFIEWDVYSGVEFERDCSPHPGMWERRELRLDLLAEELAGGRVIAWIQGRSEIGPRALGNRSLLAEPFNPDTRDRLNRIKMREGYRPIAPCCRLEDVDKVFDASFEDPYMLYFRMARTGELGAVTHVDGSARCQTVTRDTNEPLYRLLSAFAARSGVGVLCNTSLNYKGLGFINKMSDLLKYCNTRQIDDIVVGDDWFQRATPRS